MHADDVVFTSAITQSEFSKFSRVVSQAIFATPVGPARTSGILHFDVGVSATLVSVDRNAAYWQHSVPAGSNFTRGGYLAVPRLVASKGFGFATVSGMYAKVSDSEIKTWGAAVDVPVVRGTLATPELALRASYSTLSGSQNFDAKTYGGELFISKGIGPFTPYAAVGKMRTDTRGSVGTRSLSDQANLTRWTAGLRVSLLFPKLTFEASQAEVRSYAAKISIGF